MQDLQESLDHLDVNARREDKTMDKNCVHTRDTVTNNDIMGLKKNCFGSTFTCIDIF